MIVELMMTVLFDKSLNTFSFLKIGNILEGIFLDV